MIKLENSGSLPQARCLLVIESKGPTPAVALSVEEAREEINGQWVTSMHNGRQVVSGFVDSKPLKLTAKITLDLAVECPAAFKVVVEVEAKVVLSTAYEKGDKSRESCQISLLRVVEVWSTASKRLWSAQESPLTATPVDLTNGSGAISKAQLQGARS